MKNNSFNLKKKNHSIATNSNESVMNTNNMIINLG